MNDFKIVCPFCPLVCDAVHVSQDQHLPAVQVDCDFAGKRFQEALQPSPPRIAERIVPLDTVLKHLRDVVTGASQRIVSTRGVDLVSSKSLERLESMGEIHWYLQQSAFAKSWHRTSTRDGVISATLADIGQHADLIWLIGNPERQSPRLYQVLTRDVSPAKMWETAGPMDLDELASVVLATRETQSIKASLPVAELADAVASSKWLAVILGDDAFAAAEADAGLSMLIQWIWKLNSSRRAVAVYLDEAATSRSVYRWRTNRSIESTSSSFAPERSLSIHLGDITGDGERCDVMIGSVDPGFQRAEVFVPCSTVGVHRAGAIIRGDGTVTLPLDSIAVSRLPTATQWLTELFNSTGDA